MWIAVKSARKISAQLSRINIIVSTLRQKYVTRVMFGNVNLNTARKIWRIELRAIRSLCYRSHKYNWSNKNSLEKNFTYAD